VIDETLIKVGSEFIWLWIVIGPGNKRILGFNITKERNMFVVLKFVSRLTEFYINIQFQQMAVKHGINRKPVGF
jgi:putative transposase